MYVTSLTNTKVLYTYKKRQSFIYSLIKSMEAYEYFLFVFCVICFFVLLFFVFFFVKCFSGFFCVKRHSYGIKSSDGAQYMRRIISTYMYFSTTTITTHKYPNLKLGTFNYKFNGIMHHVAKLSTSWRDPETKVGGLMCDPTSVLPRVR